MIKMEEWKGETNSSSTATEVASNADQQMKATNSSSTVSNVSTTNASNPAANDSSNAIKKSSSSSNLKDQGNRNSMGNRRDRDGRSSSRGQSSGRRRSRSPINRAREDSSRSRSSNRASRRIYVANIPFDVRWAELKDLFRDKIGNVRFCQLFENEDGKPRGCGLVEFDDASSAKKAIDELNRFEFRGRELVIKEDLDMERDRYGRLILNSSQRRDNDRNGSSSSNNRDHDRRGGDLDHQHGNYDDRYHHNGSGPSDPMNPNYNTYGLSPHFLNSLGIKGPLNNRVFVANLDYKVKERHMEDIFRLAGKITKTKLYMDNDGKSKGFGVVEFEHPVEAVQAISMFNNQKLHDRILSVRLDKFDQEDDFQVNDHGLPSKLPAGLEGIGKGLGIGGQPLNISKSMLNSQLPIGPQGSVPVVDPLAPVGPATTAAINALTNLAGNLQNLPNLAQSLAHLSNATAPPPPPLANQPIGGGGGLPYSTGNDLPIDRSQTQPIHQAPYSGYQTVPPSASVQPQQPPQYQSVVSNYGQASSNNQQLPSYQQTSVGSGPSVNQSISSYSTYDQSYRDRSSIVSSQQQQQPPQPNSTVPAVTDTIYVRNLPSTFVWQNLRDRFSEIGEVRFAEMKGHGTALVRFAHTRDAQRACDLMNGIRIENRPIDVDLYF